MSRLFCTYVVKMTTEQTLTQEYQIQAEIPLAFMRYLETRTDERVLEVVLVYNGVDRFDTVIEPTGMRTDPNVVTVDYNHNRFDTGAYLRNVRVVENYKLGDGTVLEKALVGDIHIPKDAEMFHLNRDGEKVSAGSLYEAVSKGHVRSVSVEFRPYKGKQITDTKTGITTFREWDLLRLSLLDVTPGQPYSGIKITRSLINNQNNMSITIENIKSAVEAGELNKEQLRALLEQPATEERDIEIEADQKPQGETPAAEAEQPANEPDADGDGEISDEEMRSYIKEVKRAFGDKPGMMKEKMDELERMYGEMKERMDKMTPVKTEEPEVSEEEKEAQEVRALKPDLTDVPEIATGNDEGKAEKRSFSLGAEEPKKGAKEDNAYTSMYKDTLTAIQSGMFK